MADTGGEVNPPKKLDNREEKLKIVREKQAEERQKRLEELKKHALEAQQLREQKEVERRKRMEDLRLKDNERRGQVEERKKLIWEAERERREAIVRKNQEREARIDAKRRNEKSSIVFAFGSSTPRLMDTYDSGAFLMPRRATSTANLRLFPNTNMSVSMVAPSLAPPVPRRSCEREAEPKKRASSAGGLYRNPGDVMSTSMYEVFHWEAGPVKPRLSLPPKSAPSHSVPHTPVRHSKPFRHSGPAPESEDAQSASSLRVGRRKTDLMPTMPSPREGGLSSRPSSGTRSLARTPGRAYSVARLDVLAQPRTALGQPLSAPSKSMSRSTNHLAENKRFQSNSLASSDTSKSMVHLQNKTTHGGLVPRTTRAERLRNRARAAAATAKAEPLQSPGDVTPSRPGSVLSQFSLSSASTARLRSTPRRPRPFSIHVTGVTKDKDKLSSPSEEKSKLFENKEIKANRGKEVKTKEIKENKINDNKVSTHKPAVSKKQIQQKNEEIKRAQPLQPKSVESSTAAVENNNVQVVGVVQVDALVPMATEGVVEVKTDGPVVETSQDVSQVVSDLVSFADEVPATEPKIPVVPAAQQTSDLLTDRSDTDQTEDELNKANVMSRSKITTEEEAKAALAERRKLAREQAEREAEAEKLRLELEAQQEEERVRRDEEEQRLAEEEQLRLLEESRRQEEERLMQAIQEAQKREEEEKEKRQQEEAARLEKEEADKKAREEAEKQRIENVERLKREEEERTARRKRVEAIMKRTRNNTANPSNKADCEKGEEDGAEHEKDEPKGNIEAFLHGERVCTDRTLTNGQASKDHIASQHGTQSNGGTLISGGLENEDCLNSTPDPTIDTPLIAFQGKSMETPMAANYLA